jgi:hypothetical protein
MSKLRTLHVNLRVSLPCVAIKIYRELNFVVFSREICPNGTYSLGGQIDCTPCHPGFACEKRTDGPQRCEAGYYSEKNTAICSPCKAGYQCQDPAGIVST